MVGRTEKKKVGREKSNEREFWTKRLHQAKMPQPLGRSQARNTKANIRLQKGKPPDTDNDEKKKDN